MTNETAEVREARRAEGLVAAREKALALFDEVAARGPVAPGRGEREAGDLIRDPANEMFGTAKHWHKRIVRSGPNTLLPYRENPPDRVTGSDGIAFADFGAIFEEYEADPGMRGPGGSAGPGTSHGTPVTCARGVTPGAPGV